VRGDGLVFYNKCFFIALYDGLLDIAVQGEYQELDPYSLMTISGFLDSCSNDQERNALIDTDDDNHVMILDNLANLFGIRIHFFNGVQAGSFWTCVPDDYREFGHLNANGPIIRILNKPGHFEYITTETNAFITELNKKGVDQVIEDQLLQEMKIAINQGIGNDYNQNFDLQQDQANLDELHGKKAYLQNAMQDQNPSAKVDFPTIPFATFDTKKQSLNDEEIAKAMQLEMDQQDQQESDEQKRLFDHFIKKKQGFLKDEEFAKSTQNEMEQIKIKEDLYSKFFFEEMEKITQNELDQRKIKDELYSKIFFEEMEKIQD
jgi:hypothetical protein